MVGDKIGEEHGKVTGRRILPGDDPRYVKMEISFQTQSTVYGIKGIGLGTFTVYERIAGQMYGQGQGITMTETGESVIWNGAGVGAPTGDGMGMRFAAAVTYQANPNGKLAKLNGVVGMVEYTEDADGNAHSVIQEWK